VQIRLSSTDEEKSNDWEGFESLTQFRMTLPLNLQQTLQQADLPWDTDCSILYARRFQTPTGIDQNTQLAICLTQSRCPVTARCNGVILQNIETEVAGNYRYPFQPSVTHSNLLELQLDKSGCETGANAGLGEIVFIEITHFEC
jgi:hypothetical protein